MRIAMLVLNDMVADARVSREASALAAAGHEVRVLALARSGLPPVETVDGYLIERVADYSTATWRQPLRKQRELRARQGRLFEAAVATDIDAVHAHDSDTLVAAARVASARRVPLVYDAHELYPDMLQEHGLRGSWPVQAYWRSLEKRLVPEADAVITVSDGLAEELAKRFGVKPIVVANVPPLSPLLRTDRLRRELGLPEGEPIVLYQGVVIKGRGLGRLVEAFADVPRGVLVVQGDGPLLGTLRDIAEARGLDGRVHFTGHVPQRELHEYACGADVAVVIYEPTTLNNILAAPNKLYAYLMAGLPIAASDLPQVRKVVVGEGVGEVFDPGEMASIAWALRRLLESSNLGKMGEHARHLAETRYNWDIEKQKLLALYEELAARST